MRLGYTGTPCPAGQGPLCEGLIEESPLPRAWYMRPGGDVGLMGPFERSRRLIQFEVATIIILPHTQFP